MENIFHLSSIFRSRFLSIQYKEDGRRFEEK